MADETTPHDMPTDLDALESQLDEVDPADAPPIAEDLASALGDALEATQEGSGRSSTSEADPSEGDSP